MQRLTPSLALYGQLVVHLKLLNRFRSEFHRQSGTQLVHKLRVASQHPSKAQVAEGSLHFRYL
jgi:hypothetical protein